MTARAGDREKAERVVSVHKVGWETLPGWRTSDQVWGLGLSSTVGAEREPTPIELLPSPCLQKASERGHSSQWDQEGGERNYSGSFETRASSYCSKRAVLGFPVRGLMMHHSL